MSSEQIEELEKTREEAKGDNVKAESHGGL